MKIGPVIVGGRDEWLRMRTAPYPDSAPEEIDGSRAHLAMGYEEVERQICVRKTL